MFNIIMIEGDEDGLGAVSNYKPVGEFKEGVQYIVHEEELYGHKNYPVIQYSEREDGTQEQDYLYQEGQPLQLRENETCAQAVYRFMSSKGIASTLAE
jgi:hypothetical protein